FVVEIEPGCFGGARFIKKKRYNRHRRNSNSIIRWRLPGPVVGMRSEERLFQKSVVSSAAKNLNIFTGQLRFRNNIFGYNYTDKTLILHS
ncbi:MAG TPA: hypothetical protein VHO90_16985, partial [Bacteroidales bacterium]|nr:hypothetical protein [Bacteroidales bacterium]